MRDVHIDDIPLISNHIPVAHTLGKSLIIAALDDILNLIRNLLRPHMGRSRWNAGSTTHRQLGRAVSRKVAAAAAGDAVISAVGLHDAFDAHDVLTFDVVAGNAAVVVGGAGSLHKKGADGDGGD